MPILAGREAYNALKSAGANVSYREFYGAGQDETWTDAFNDPVLIPWLFSQQKK